VPKLIYEKIALGIGGGVSHQFKARPANISFNLNFETDTLPKKLLDKNNNIVFQETRIYARWERN